MSDDAFEEEDVPDEEPDAEEPAVGEPAVGEAAVGEPAVGEAAVGEAAVGVAAGDSSEDPAAPSSGEEAEDRVDTDVDPDCDKLESAGILLGA